MAYLLMSQLEAAQLMEAFSNHQLPLANVLVPQAEAFAQQHKFALTARWLRLEREGYRAPGGGPASIDGLLQVPAGHSLVRRVLGYRVMEGRILLRFGPEGPLLPLPVNKLTVHGVAEIEAKAYGPDASFEGRVPLIHLPKHPISEQLAQRAHAKGQDFVPATFPREQFVKLLAGLRREILRMLSDCMATGTPE